jgi:hypothetical protein
MWGFFNYKYLSLCKPNEMIIDGVVTFNLAQGKYVIEDTTDYSGQSVNPADAAIVFSITGPAGLVLHNNPDFDNPDIEAEETFDSVSLATDAQGNVLSGNHTIVMRVRIDDGVNPAEIFEKTFVCNYQFQSPSLSQNIVIDYYSPLISSTDTTGYLVSGVMPLVVRDHRIIYPAAAQVADTTSAGAYVSSGQFYTVDGGIEHTFRLSVELMYSFSNFNVYVELENQEVRLIESPQDVCKIYCALKAAQKRFEAAKCTNATNLAKALQDFASMVGLAQMIQFAYRCGKIADIAAYKAMLLKIGNSTDDCCCGGDTPSLVTGIGGFGSATIVAAGTGIVVSFDGNVTYTVSIDPSILQVLEGGGYDVDSPDASINVTSSVDQDGVTTFSISVANPVRMLSVKTPILFNASLLPTGLGSVTYIHKKYGTWNDPAIGGGTPFMQIDPQITDQSQYLTNPVVLEFGNVGISNMPFFVNIEKASFMNESGNPITQYYDVRAEVFGVNQTTGKFYVRMVRHDGTPHTGASLAASTLANSIIVTLHLQIVV